MARIVSVEIYDRWGGLLFSIASPEEEERVRWNGYTKNGELVRAGVYFYQVNIAYLDGSSDLRSGAITVIQ